MFIPIGAFTLVRTDWRVDTDLTAKARVFHAFVHVHTGLLEVIGGGSGCVYFQLVSTLTRTVQPTVVVHWVACQSRAVVLTCDVSLYVLRI